MKLSKSVFMRPGCSRRQTADCAQISSTIWVVYGCVPLIRPNLVAPSLEGLPARESRHSVPNFHDGDYHAHRHVLISGVGGAHDDRPGWTPH